MLDQSCGLTGDRTVSPRVIEERGEVAVEVKYRYQCPTTVRRVHFFLLVENSSELQRSGWEGRRLVEHVREGLRAFVDQFDFAAGSRGGMILYTRTARVASELQDESGRQQLINAIENFPANAGNSGAGVGAAINEAMRQLTAAPAAGEAMNVLMILQAGDSLANPPEDIDAACRAAKDKGATIGLLTLDGVKEPVTTCASEGWTRASPRDDGDDVPDILKQLGAGFARGDQPAKVEYCDNVSQTFELVVGSAEPRPPDSEVIGQICWEDKAPPAPDGYTIRYRLRGAPSMSDLVESTSTEALVRLTFLDSSSTQITVPIPEVCIYRRGQPRFCDTFAGRLTQTPLATPQTTATTPVPPTTMEPTNTPVATTPPPTEAVTETPVASPPTTEAPATATTPATSVPPGWRIYLPALLDKKEIGRQGPARQRIWPASRSIRVLHAENRSVRER